MKLKVKNWAEFQHYKDRSPPWIKLHKHLLDDYEFHCLPVASRALAPLLWLVASDDLDGIIDGNLEKLAFRFRQSEKQISDALKPLIDSGFFEVVQDASNALADRKPDAPLEEKSKEEKSARKRAPSLIPLPENFGISPRLAEWASKNGVQNLPAHVENFIGVCKAKGYTYADWDEAAMGAIRKDWAKIGKGSGSGLAL